MKLYCVIYENCFEGPIGVVHILYNASGVGGYFWILL